MNALSYLSKNDTGVSHIISQRHSSQVSPTQLPSFILPFPFKPSTLYVSTAPALGSSSGHPLSLLNLNSSSLTANVTSILNLTASSPVFNPSLSSTPNSLLLFLSSFSLSLLHRSLKPSQTSFRTRSPNVTLILFPILGHHRGDPRLSCITRSKPSIHIGTTSGHGSLSRMRRAIPHFR